MSKIATIEVIYKPGKYKMIINESDFDKEIHEKVKADKPAGDKPAAEKPAVAKPAKPEKPVEDEELKALIGEE